MMLSDLQNKEIVNLNDGKNIGVIIDVRVDLETGRIISLLIEPKSKFLNFSRGEDMEINWRNIERIGEDVILVRLN